MRSKEREAEKKNASEKKEKSTAQNILGTIAYIVGVCVFVFLILHFVGQRTVVNGSSMDTTLANGQNLVMDKLSYRFHDPERYDIIVFPYQHAENTYYIKFFQVRKSLDSIHIISSESSECREKLYRLKMVKFISMIKN